MKSILKADSFNLFWTKPLRKVNFEAKFGFLKKKNFNFSAEIGFFFTNKESNFGISLDVFEFFRFGLFFLF